MEKPEAERKSNRRFDPISRGNKRPSPIGTALFVGLRAVDPLLQYGILAHGIGSSVLRTIGLEVLPAGLPISTGIKLVDGLGLSPYRLILLTMATGSSIKQIFWLLYTSKEEFLPASALEVAGFNTAMNSIANLAFTTSLLSGSLSGGGQFPQPPLVVGSLLYVGGILIETCAEVQRKKFKDDPQNKGKIYTGGLWTFVRHANYAGYLAWRTGYYLAACGWGAGVVAAAFFSYQFVSNSIPTLDEYCTKRVSERTRERPRDENMLMEYSTVFSGRNINARRLMRSFLAFGECLSQPFFVCLFDTEKLQNKKN